jgi:hypothetical protein
MARLSCLPFDDRSLVRTLACMISDRILATAFVIGACPQKQRHIRLAETIAPQGLFSLYPLRHFSLTTLLMMRSSIILCLTALLPTALGYPAYMQPERRQNLTGAAGGLGSLVNGLVGGVAAIVDPANKRPDAAHPFVAPGPTDQRGPW